MPPTINPQPAARSPANFLLIAVFAMSFVFGVWQVLLNNFVIERAGFTGIEIGILQSLREIPGFLAFLAVYLLFFLREQRLALIALLVTSIGVAITGQFATTLGLYLTTVLMSTGFHYFETMNKSLTLQWLHQSETSHFLGRALSTKALASLIAYGIIWLAMSWAGLDYAALYLFSGLVGVLLVALLWFGFPQFKPAIVQTRGLVLRKRYWMFYALIFLSGARRQIFMVFAGFMMVQKYGYSVANISLLFIVTYVFNLLFAARIGRWIGRIGEQRAMLIEYTGLVLIFSGYALINNAWAAASFYVADHLLFAMAIAVSTYFQKIADPADIASSASVSFSINHIAAIIIPAALGLLWQHSPALVFFIGVGFAGISLLLALNVPRHPGRSHEARWQPFAEQETLSQH